MRTFAQAGHGRGHPHLVDPGLANTSTIISKLTELGVRHARDWMAIDKEMLTPPASSTWVIYKRATKP